MAMTDTAKSIAPDTGLLRFITCGSVDDGKSTLLGRLLYDAGMVPDDQLATLVRDSRKPQGGDPDTLDFSLLTDGLDAERQQGITIDVAYRYFHTPRRNFIVADCPGHEQYTRNMATGASTAQLAVVLVDARKGLLPQTRRHSYICALMGIRQVVLAVNKMDLVDCREDIYAAIAHEYRELATQLGITTVHCLPVIAPGGDNVGKRSTRMPWYQGPTLLEWLEAADTVVAQAEEFRMPVQWVNRPDASFRGYAGTVSGGRLAVGSEIVVQPAMRRARVERIVTADGDLQEAVAGQAVTLTLDREIDVSRGDVIADAARPAPVADQFAAHILWMGDESLLPNRAYWLKIGSRTVNARITSIKHKVDVNTQAELAARRLDLNEVGYCNIDLDHAVAFESYATNRTLGGFILIDRTTHATVGCGMLDFALRRAANVHWQHTDLDKEVRSVSKGQQPRCLWFTGLSGAGKSTIANLVERRLHSLGYHTYMLDGDNLRHGLNKDLGFTPEARVENVRRVAEVAHLMVDAGLIVLVCVISPFQSERQFARSLFDGGEFLEVFVDTTLDECERRDPKGLYRKARAGEIINFTGIDSPYEVPDAAELRLRTAGLRPEQLAEQVVEQLLTGLGHSPHTP
ncbi:MULTISPECIES: sulfate adenylyltransferase subunit CysN [Dyella]|uniref:sulfate adenylyltransferase subunit CysN n=1 Tax=Dyella TaxID=231454 RepID=UPI000C83332F|nr:MULTISPECIES: sulfate adenylyltransferase subunit CysN [Dyella]MDR3444374.1 sulfate adenylyltransferase subunit CysN [Dyella sp.]PMQ06043.1 Bifunctional enzyme CysN/CysC [Dyella sp. AD56]ULU25185.1 sulfate adenylyltransferase subunit CysN [Dyella terrae]